MTMVARRPADLTLTAHRVVVASPDALVRDLLRAVLHDRGLHVVGETSRLDELVELVEEEAPEAVVTAAELAGGAVDGWIGRLSAATRVVVLCDDRSPERLTHLLAAGAAGFLLHDSAPAHVADAVRAVASGAAFLDPTAAAVVLEQWRHLRTATQASSARPSALTARELDVLRAMADGLSTKAIARRLGVAEKTIENHKTRIFDKLAVRSQAQAVQFAISHGLLAGAPHPAVETLG